MLIAARCGDIYLSATGIIDTYIRNRLSSSRCHDDDAILTEDLQIAFSESFLQARTLNNEEAVLDFQEGR